MISEEPRFVLTCKTESWTKSACVNQLHSEVVAGADSTEAPAGPPWSLALDRGFRTVSPGHGLWVQVLPIRAR